MLEVVINNVEYLLGVPQELTREAVTSGAIKKGETVGLKVSPVDNPLEEFIIDLKLWEYGQEKLIKSGQIIPISETYQCSSEGYGRCLGNKHILHHTWRNYVDGLLD